MQKSYFLLRCVRTQNILRSVSKLLPYRERAELSGNKLGLPGNRGQPHWGPTEPLWGW